MQKISLYPEQNDLKNYIEKVSKVFFKMEKDLASYRIKGNDSEKLLKMLKKVMIGIIHTYLNKIINYYKESLSK